ncbi:hypothetical protein G9A89_006880 [Geosiphon pyriformis]|nr:hypothetical protein G9A89_006880 [Geosiphon pyriformis]
MIEPVGLFADGSGLISAGLETPSVINLFAGSLSLENVASTSEKLTVSWDSEMGSKASSISGLLDVKNMRNTVAEKMSYVNSDNLVVDKDMDDTTL